MAKKNLDKKKETASSTLNGTLSGTLNCVLVCIKENPRIQANHISNMLEKLIDTIKKQVKQLMDK